ncbi:Signal transduction histidine kinase [Lachnospiraceae bacterium NE2001]|nr:Signal transduction histidine kinase [Lachnospiraceae bacterium NE2001]
MKNERKGISIYIIGGLVVLLILFFGTIILGQQARIDNENAVRKVSLLYLDELAGRREQVVEDNLKESIDDIEVAVGLMTDEDTSDMEHIQAYQAKMKKLFNLEKFAFVDEDGLIYTALGTQDNIHEYSFDYKTLSEPEISVLNLESLDKKVVIAIPVEIPFDGKTLKVCFMEKDMDEMLSGVSMESSEDNATFCNIYTQSGVALSNTILGGLAVEDNLIDAMKNAEFDNGYSYDKFVQEFGGGESGEVSFTYNDINETLSYEPVEGTDWQLTYLVRESVISEEIGSISRGIIIRSLIQSLLLAFCLVAMFSFIIFQVRKNSKVLLEKEKAEAESRARQQEMQERLDLQEKLLEEEKKRALQDNLITAMASDYRSVYYADLDNDDAVCYRGDSDDTDQSPEGTHFRFSERFRYYAETHVAEEYREGFLKFIDIDNIRSTLSESRLMTYRYLVRFEDKEFYEMLRMAGVRLAANRDDGIVHDVGVGFTIIDKEMREEMARNELLSEALASAEQANKAKTAFLSNMSHEIRTPMNAIIGLDSIALNDAETPEKTKGYLTKIGESANHMLSLINDILDMSRIESGRMVIKNEEFSFPQLLEALNTMFSGQCQEKGLDYQCHVSSDVNDFYIGDGLKLRQVLINVIGNAVKFTEKGSVSFNVKKTAGYDGKSTLVFEVVDTGIGISDEFLPHLFDTFAQEDESTTSKYGSSGLGMAITKNIVEMMNGNIEVKTKKDEGTTFYITVTLSDVDKNENQSGDVEINPEEMSVLIIDDDEVACEHARLVLEKAGISSEIAMSGEEAIEKVKLRHARRMPYNLILVDWKMPGMDGVETTRRIREIVGNESAIIILTAYRWDDVLEEALQAGVDSFVAKPLFATVVIEEFKSALKRKSVQGSSTKKVDLAGKRILLAEDMQVNAEIMMMVLEMREMKVDIAENGRVALEKFDSSEPGYYDAILMDMRMPEMDGLEATKRIRGLDRDDAKTIPIIALTANAFDEDVQRSLQVGMNAHLSKPVEPERLYQTLEEFIQ